MGYLLGVWVLFYLFLGNFVLRFVRCVPFSHIHYKETAGGYRNTWYANTDYDLSSHIKPLTLELYENDCGVCAIIRWVQYFIRVISTQKSDEADPLQHG